MPLVLFTNKKKFKVIICCSYLKPYVTAINTKQTSVKIAKYKVRKFHGFNRKSGFNSNTYCFSKFSIAKLTAQ